MIVSLNHLAKSKIVYRFGLGIDKQNVSQVVHFMMPKSMVNYGQEVGRCGRNGLPGECLMLPADFDLPILESFV